MSAVFSGWYGSGHDDRTFHYAIAASLVLHALLLFAVPGLRESRSTPDNPGVLVAHIVEPPRAAPQAPVARTPEPPKPRVEPPPPPPPVRKPSPLAERAAEPAPPPPVAEPATPSAEPAPVAPSAAPPGPVARTDPSPSNAAPPDAAAGALGEYERQLRIAAARYKRYPRVAIDNNWEGTVEVTMVVTATGVISSISVETSTGYKTLDDQAMEMVRRAKPFIAIPPALRGREFTVKLRAIYSLKDAEGG